MSLLRSNAVCSSILPSKSGTMSTQGILACNASHSGLDLFILTLTISHVRPPTSGGLAPKVAALRGRRRGFQCHSKFYDTETDSEALQCRPSRNGYASSNAIFFSMEKFDLPLTFQ